MPVDTATVQRAVTTARLLPIPNVAGARRSPSHSRHIRSPAVSPEVNCEDSVRASATAQRSATRGSALNVCLRILEDPDMLTARTSIERPEARRSRATHATPPSATARRIDRRTTPVSREAILRVEGEYREMPGLSLTLPQAARLWGLDPSTCERVLTTLIERRVLKRAWNGTYVRR
jgi:hypothetical protein